MGRARDREEKEQRARTAREAAADAFYRMDLAQRDIAVQVEAYANTDADPRLADRLRREYANLSAQADERSQRYLATIDAYPIDDRADAAGLDTAVYAFGEATKDIAAMASTLLNFAERNAPLFAQVGKALDRAAARTAAASAALAQARAAVAALAEADIAPGAAGEALAEAEAAAAEMAGGTAAHGVAGVSALAERVAAAAAHATSLAADLPRRKEEVTRRLSSIRTRRDAIAHQATLIPDLLRHLRRAYAEGCWADLADAEERIGAAVAAADAEVDGARAAVRGGDWDAAAAALGRAVALLDDGARLAAAARERSGKLEEARKDPGGRVKAARATLRDAQRMVMAGQAAPPMPWARELDSLAARLDRAEDILAGVHPDYWAFLRELDAVGAATAGVVQRFRAAARG